jgi:hypothetical protein
MVPSRLALPLCLLLLTAFAGCPCRGYGDRKYAAPTAEEVMAHLAERRAALRSYKDTDSTMDYWIGKDRFRGTVMVMGTLGAKVRINAISPQNTVAVDLACDGVDFVLVDQLNDCVLVGPCTERSIGELLRVPLAPDDFLHLALGATPVLAGARGTLRWDADKGREILELTAPGGASQTIILDGRDGQRTWDLLRSEVRGADGKVLWTADHTAYRLVKDVAGVTHRVPGKSNFKTPAEKSDLLVEWGGAREINLELDEELFRLEAPPVPTCARKGAPSP